MADDWRLTPEQERELVENLGLVKMSISRILKVGSSMPQFEDFYQSGCIGLCKAIKHREPDREGRTTFYIKSILRQVHHDHIRPYKCAKRGFGAETIRLDDMLPQMRDGKRLTFADTYLRADDFVPQLLSDIIYGPIVTLLREKAPTYCRHALDGEKWAAIANDLNLTPQGAQHRAKSEYKKISRQIQKMSGQPTAIG